MIQLTGLLNVVVDEIKIKQYHDLGVRVICLTDDTTIRQQMPSVMFGSVFLPPYEAMTMLLDGDRQGFELAYSEYLYHSEEVNIMVTIIIAALAKGINISLYVPRKEYELGFFNVFASCLTYMTGIYCGFEDTMAPAYDFNYNNANLERLYMHGFMSYQDFMTGYDGASMNNPIVCRALCADIGYFPEQDQDAINFIVAHKKSIMDNNNAYLKKGFIPA